MPMNLYCTESTLRRRLTKLGFKIKMINKRAGVMESRRIVKWRIEYLEKIKEFRDKGKQIIIWTKPGMTPTTLRKKVGLMTLADVS